MLTQRWNLQGTRRRFLEATVVAVGTLLPPAPPTRAVDEPRLEAERAGAVKVVVCDTWQPAQQQGCETLLGNAIVTRLRSQPGLSVTSIGLDDPGQGLSAAVLGDCEMLD